MIQQSSQLFVGKQASYLGSYVHTHPLPPPSHVTPSSHLTQTHGILAAVDNDALAGWLYTLSRAGHVREPRQRLTESYIVSLKTNLL